MTTTTILALATSLILVLALHERAVSTTRMFTMGVLVICLAAVTVTLGRPTPDLVMVLNAVADLIRALADLVHGSAPQ